MLFEPDRHEALADVAWEASQARQAIQAIVKDTEQCRTALTRWPLHPRDDEGDEPQTGFKDLYLGAAGVLWALWSLQRAGAVELSCDTAAEITAVEAAYRVETEAGPAVPSYLMGEVGIQLVRWRLTGSIEAAERLYAAVRSNIPNPTNEALWGAPGTMVAAWHLWAATGEERWRELFLENVEQVWQTWLFDARAGCHLWTQDMYGKVVQYLGAGHGHAGNVYPLLKGAALLDADRRGVLYERCVATLRATARFEGDGVNWPAGTYTPRPGQTGMLMQWCHGAPGIITALADFPPRYSSDLDAWLIAAGHTIWQAGPLKKGHGLCHGTAGNGYAFLKLHQRTGDSLWLQRARLFAMHALMQMQQMRQQHGQGRYTLWTGDLGLAVYLWHCINGTASLPALDSLD